MNGRDSKSLQLNFWKTEFHMFRWNWILNRGKMSRTIILGEAFSFLAAVFLAYSTFSNKKKNMIWWQAVNAIFYCISNMFLGGYSAVITNVLTVIRNEMFEKISLFTDR